MQTSTRFSHVPLIGYGNIIRVRDNDANADKKFIVAKENTQFQPAYVGRWVPPAVRGDGGSTAVDSYTDKDPTGRTGNMITHVELLDLTAPSSIPRPNFLMLVAIPSGMAPGATSPLLDKQFSLSNQPPAESFDYSKFLPRVDARGCLSLYTSQLGGGNFDTDSFTAMDRFPTIPHLLPMREALGGTLFYLPPGFYGNINTILNDLTDTVGQFNITLLDTPQYGILCINAQYLDFQNEHSDGSGCLTVDFSHSGTN
jgi:hypothetical protein